MVSDAWLTLLQAARPGARRWTKLLTSLGTPERLCASSAEALADAGIAPEAVERLRRPDPDVSARWRQWLSGPNRSLITIDDPAYPPRLAELSSAPLALWVEGSDRSLLAAPQLAMVGSRNPTRAARRTAESMARFLSERGLTVTSGLAAGIDSASHRGALAGTGSTVAVLGTGPDRVYPAAHRPLAREIADRGLLVSEYPPGAGAKPHHFPCRNRIIAGLSVGTLVVEASIRSGSLITARHATEYGREVFAMPGSIHNPLARGCHRLIREGAKLVEDAADVLVELAPILGLTYVPEPSAPSETTPASSLITEPGYRELWDALGFEPTAIGDLARATALTAAELSSMLLLLELEGFVEASPGGRYSRIAKRSP